MGHQHGRGFIVFRHGGRTILEHIVGPTRVTSSFHRNRLLILGIRRSTYKFNFRTDTALKKGMRSRF